MRLAVSCSLLAAFAVSAASCYSSTVIESSPSGADVYLDGAHVGKTPYRMGDRKLMGAATAVHLEAPGYEPLDATIVRNETNNGWCAASFLFAAGIPCFWVLGYDPVHGYGLTPGSYLSYYADERVQPGLPDVQLAPPDGPPQIVHGTDEAHDGETMKSRGFVEIGASRFNDDDMPIVRNEDLARLAAINKGAAVVFLYTRATGTVNRGITTPTGGSQVTTWSRPDGSTGTREVDDYGSTTTNVTVARFDYTATFWARPAVRS